MENKKKPSNLYLVPTHHDFNNLNEKKLFEIEMLEWPIFDYSEKKEITDPIFIKVHRNAIEALTMLGGNFGSRFSAKISIGANLEQKRLLMPDRRTWGEIYLGEKCILTFSHDGRETNRPFTSLFEWPEFNNGNSDEEWKRVLEILYLWDTEQWKYFFIQKIKIRSQILLSKAEAKRNDAKELEDSAHKMLFALI